MRELREESVLVPPHPLAPPFMPSRRPPSLHHLSLAPSQTSPHNFPRPYTYTPAQPLRQPQPLPSAAASAQSERWNRDAKLVQGLPARSTDARPPSRSDSALPEAAQTAPNELEPASTGAWYGQAACLNLPPPEDGTISDGAGALPQATFPAHVLDARAPADPCEPTSRNGRARGIEPSPLLRPCARRAGHPGS